MKRTATYESCPLNKGKRIRITGLVGGFSRLKDRALSILGRTLVGVSVSEREHGCLDAYHPKRPKPATHRHMRHARDLRCGSPQLTP